MLDFEKTAMLKSENLEGYKIAFHERIVERTLMVAEHIKCTHETIRETAQKFGCSKSTVHCDVSYRLPQIDEELYKETKKVLDKNFTEKHIRGGEATRRKYAEMN